MTLTFTSSDEDKVEPKTNTLIKT